MIVLLSRIKAAPKVNVELQLPLTVQGTLQPMRIPLSLNLKVNQPLIKV
jgi:hypothetical protein